MADVRSGHSGPTPTASTPSIRLQHPGNLTLLTRPLACRPCQHLWIDDVDRLASRKGDDLVENVDKLRLVFLARHISDVRRRDDLFELQQREIRSRIGSSSNTSTAA